MTDVEELPVTEARARFAELVNIVGYGKKRVVLTKHGKPLVALVPAEDLLTDDAGDSAATVLDLTSQPSGARSAFTTAAHDDRSHQV
jgi:prevent-host-death family protein